MNNSITFQEEVIVFTLLLGRKHNLRLGSFPLFFSSLTGSTTRYKYRAQYEKRYYFKFHFHSVS